MSGRLVYRLVNITFADDFYSLWSDSEVTRYTAVPENITYADTEKKLMNWVGESIFVIFRDGEFIGVVGCPTVNKASREYGFFYQLKRSEWGKGYAAEAANWVVGYMSRIYGDVVLYAHAVTANAASEKILNNLGFKIIGEKQESVKGRLLTVRSYKFNTFNND